MLCDEKKKIEILKKYKYRYKYLFTAASDHG